MSGGGAPADYAEMFDRYYDLVRHWVRKAHIVEQDVDDVAMDLIVKFIAKQGLENYDPERVGPTGRRATFTTSLSAFMRTYVMDCRDKQMYRYRREVLTDAQVESSYEVPFEAAVEFDEWVAEVGAYLRGSPPHGERLAVVFSALVDEVRRGEPLGVVERSVTTQRALGVSRASAWTAIRDLKLALVEGGFA